MASMARDGELVRRGLRAVVAAALALGAVPARALLAEEVDDSIVRVEEDWELVLNEPNENVESPQFHTVMSPVGNADSFYAQVVWNYRETPDFAFGGVQLQGWNDDALITSRAVRNTPLSTQAETITWSQVLDLSNGTLNFSVENGQSVTWGHFDRDMKISSATNLSNLGSYSPDVSAAQTCITYGSNRVDTLVIREIRYYSESGLVRTDTTRRVVYQLPEDEE